jgi:hypothetical protein
MNTTPWVCSSQQKAFCWERFHSQSWGSLGNFADWPFQLLDIVILFIPVPNEQADALFSTLISANGKTIPHLDAEFIKARGLFFTCRDVKKFKVGLQICQLAWQPDWKSYSQDHGTSIIYCCFKRSWRLGVYQLPVASCYQRQICWSPSLHTKMTSKVDVALLRAGPAIGIIHNHHNSFFILSLLDYSSRRLLAAKYAMSARPWKQGNASSWHLFRRFSRSIRLAFA